MARSLPELVANRNVRAFAGPTTRLGAGGGSSGATRRPSRPRFGVRAHTSASAPYCTASLHIRRAAARAQPAVLAREGHQHVVRTALAVAAQKASRDVSAREVVLEGVDHILRERRGVGALRVREEGREVLADEAVEHGVVRPSGNIFSRQSEGWARTREGRHAARFAAGVPGDEPRVFSAIGAWRAWRRHGGWRAATTQAWARARRRAATPSGHARPTRRAPAPRPSRCAPRQRPAARRTAAGAA